MAISKPKPLSLQDRLRANVKAAPATPFIPPEPEEIIPDLRELIDIPAADRNKLQGLVTASAEWQLAESEAKKARKPLTEQIKKLVGSYSLSKFRVGSIQASYYNAPRSSLSKDKLLQAGVPMATILACTVTADSYTLRITQPGQEED